MIIFNIREFLKQNWNPFLSKEDINIDEFLEYLIR
jgi:hypothetical protein